MTAQSILISGAGIAGPALAYWLRAAGFQPTIVERAPALRGGGYVIDFWGLGYEIAQQMNLQSAIERVGYRMREVRIVGDRGERAGGFGADVFRELTGGRYVTLARSDLSRMLYECIADSTEVIFGDEIVDVHESAGSVQVSLAHSGERRFDLLIGADGLHSGVRHLVFGSENLFEKPLGYAVAACEVGGYRPRDPDVYVMYGQPGRMLGRFALHNDRTLFLFVFTVDSGELPTAVAEQKAALRERYGDGEWECRHILTELDGVNELYFDRVSQIRMDHWSQGRVALIGDAAFCVSLLAGQGSALAMISAYVLAGELASAAGNYERAFATYEKTLRSFIETKQQGAERFAGAFAPRTQWGLWFRNQMTKAFAIPGLARFALGGEIVDTLSLPDYRPWFLDPVQRASQHRNPHRARSG
jgi:2-polyprenyl-6-methoxyphenol hydroxylase-like FAD-dependent oxidoreductase